MEHDLFKEFDVNKCTFCGECLNKCPVMHLPLNIAKDEVKRLIEGKSTKYALQRCTSCFACNLYCPEYANPTQLILYRWYKEISEKGLPLRAEWFLPHNKPNFRTYVIERLPEDEKALLKHWENLKPTEEIFYPGCNIITSPYLTRTKLLDGFEIRGSLDTCCGEMYYRMGLFEQVRQTAKKLENYFRKLKVRKIVIPCTAGYNMFTNVLPRFGFQYKVEVRHLLPIILDKLESGKIKIKKKLNMTVTIQDSCYAKVIENIAGTVRDILGFIGVKVIEAEYSRENSLCCGIGAGFSPYSGYHPLDLLRAGTRNIKMFKATGADVILVYCAGCLQVLSTVGVVYPMKPPIYHILELLQLAIGEKPSRRNIGRGRIFFRGIATNQFPKLITRKRIREINIGEDISRSLY